MTALQATTKNTSLKVNHLHREASFYQEAFIASLPYIQQLGSLLVSDYGFRQVNAVDVFMLEPVIQSCTPGSTVLNLISTPLLPLSSPDDITAGTIHLIQLPLDITSLLNCGAFASNSPACLKGMKRIAFATILSSDGCLVTEETFAIPSLRDLVLFLQCLLPSSSALALSLALSTRSHIAPEAKSNKKERKALEIVEKEREDKLAHVHTWRSKTIKSDAK
ncbi:hypothetical protein L204_100604 [Cryptococcus depauperatus]|nr:hypothetical protein L204_01464 [Cryptococcus depauperatus CBS 7855]